MEQPFIYIALMMFGAIFGSFAAATVWRLRAHQLQADKKNHEKYDKKEYSKLNKLMNRKVSTDHSCCLSCGYKLRWYDLIPVISWLFLRGKCRKCRSSIGYMEILSEVILASFFVLSYAFWPDGVTTWLSAAHFILWLGAGVAMAILFMYDFRWYLIPNNVVTILIFIGIAITAITAIEAQNFSAIAISAVLAVTILGGLYAMLYLVSKGRWVGFGDVLLGFGLALLLVDWRLAFIALFLANLVGTLIVIPGLITKKLQRTSRVPFGPMLITGTVLAWLAGPTILIWYLGLLGM